MSKTELTLDEKESWKHSKKDYLIRPTAMNKAEETIKIIRGNGTYNEKLKALNEYANEVSRERAKAAFYYGYDAQLSHRNFDDWKSNREESK